MKANNKLKGQAISRQSTVDGESFGMSKRSDQTGLADTQVFACLGFRQRRFFKMHVVDVPHCYVR